MKLQTPFSVACLGGRVFCFVSPARVAGSSLTYAERPASKAYGPRGMCIRSYLNESYMKKFGTFAAGMKALEGMLK